MAYERSSWLRQDSVGLHHSKQHRETLSKGPRHFSYEPFSLFFTKKIAKIGLHLRRCRTNK